MYQHWLWTESARVNACLNYACAREPSAYWLSIHVERHVLHACIRRAARCAHVCIPAVGPGPDELDQAPLGC
eukprot:6195750-Pleurochrysis_carterae.AAC.2